MCLPSDAPALECWLNGQLRIVRALRDEAIMRGDSDSTLSRTLSGHYAWLARELAALTNSERFSNDGAVEAA